MTTLLDDAITEVRKLPDDQQDRAAKVLFQIVSRSEGRSRLTPEQIEEVLQIEEGLANGTERWATDEEVDAMWQRFRV